MRRRILALAAVLPVLLVGCSGASHHSSDPSTSAAGRTSATPNPDVVPAVITPAYVNAVFAVLNHINGNASRALLKEGKVSSDVRSDLRAVYSDPLYGKELSIETESLAGSLANVRRPPGDVVTTVERLISASPTCIFAETRADYGAVLWNPGPQPASAYLELTPKQLDSDPKGLNPTPWSISFNAVYKSPTSLPTQCPASSR